MAGKSINDNKENIYCFCVTKEADHVVKSIAGMDSAYKLYFISYKDINMVVGNVPGDEFTEDKLNNAASDISWLSRNAIRHNKIVDTVMKYCHPILPLKFCTIYKDKRSIEMILESLYTKFREALDYFDGKIEYGLKIYMEKKVFQEKIKSNTEDELKISGSNSSGRNYLLRRKLEKQTHETLNNEITLRRKAMHSVVSEWATESVSNRLLDPGTDNKDEMLILNSSYLVEDIYLDKFFLAIKRLNNSAEHEGFKFVTSGPWPCYSFSSKINV